MRTTRVAILVAIGALALVALPGAASGSDPVSSGHAKASGKCKPSSTPLTPPTLPRKIIRLGDSYAGSQSPMPKSKVKRILAVVWGHLYKKCHHRKITRSALRYRVSGNLNQIKHDSGFIPAARSPTGEHAEGLLQMIKPVFRKWHIPGYRRVTNPVDDILAGVNIQLNADKVVSVTEPGYVFPHNVLNGRHGGWGLQGGDNPYHPFR